MRVLILNEHDVGSLLTMADCIGVMEEAFRALARGETHQPLRQLVRAEGAAGFLGLMPAYIGGATPRFGLKEVCVFPANPRRGLDTHLGVVLLHSGETGELLAIASAAAITAIRTAAVSAVATKLLARADASTLTILGSGAQAQNHLQAIPLVRPIRRIRIFGRRFETVEKLAASAARLGEVKVAGSAEEALDGADVIVTATSSKEAVVRREWIAGGAHINAVGSSVRTARELDGATMAASKLFVDRRESTTNESGDYLMALEEGSIGASHIRGEIGELLLGRIPGRENDEEITLFKSLGLAIEDLASISFLYDRAQQTGQGTWVEV